MKRRFLFSVFALSAAVALSAAETASGFLAEWNGQKIFRSDVLALVPAENRTGDPADAPDVWKKAVNETVYRRILLGFLTAEKAPPSYEEALSFLEKFGKLMSADAQTGLDARRQELARHPDMQLNIAFFQYLNRKCPDRMNITDEEAAAAYRAAPQRLARPTRIVYGFLQFDGDVTAAEKKAWSARARLLQGGDFDRLAAEINPKGVHNLPPELADALLKAFPKPQKLQVSSPITIRQKVYLVQIREYEPRRLCTLEESLPFWRFQLAMKRVSLFMQNLLQKELERRPIIYQRPLR